MCVLCVLRDPRARRQGNVLRKLLGGSSLASRHRISPECETFPGSQRIFSAVPAAASVEGAEVNKIDGYVLHPSTLNPNILKAKYAVRGDIYTKAQELAAEGREIIYTNGKRL